MILYTQVLPTTNNLALFVRLRSSSFGWFWNQTGTKRNESGTKGNQGEAKRNQSGLKSRISEIVFGISAKRFRISQTLVSSDNRIPVFLKGGYLLTYGTGAQFGFS